MSDTPPIDPEDTPTTDPEVPSDDTPTEETPVEDVPSEDEPTDDTPVDDGGGLIGGDEPPADGGEPTEGDDGGLIGGEEPLPEEPIHIQAITRRIGYAASPLDDTARRHQLTTEWEEVDYMRFTNGYVSRDRLLVVTLSMGITVPDDPSGYLTFRLYAGEGMDVTRADAVLVDELSFAITGEPFNPVGFFNCPTTEDYTNLCLFVEAHLSEGTGEIHLSAAAPRRMHSMVMAVDTGPLQ